VTYFGLLRHGPNQEGDLRERFVDWEDEAVQLRGLMKLYEQARLSLAGDRNADAYLEGSADVRAELELNPPRITNRATIAAAATDALSGQIAARMEGEGVWLTLTSASQWRDPEQRPAGGPGEFVSTGVPANLIAWAYHDLGMAVNYHELRGVREYVPPRPRAQAVLHARLRQSCSPKTAAWAESTKTEIEG
jgi:hypothetical protein